MASFSRFEDILAWQKAREVNKSIALLMKEPVFASDLDLRSQIRRASISIMANIAEGFGRRSRKEFANFLNIAHASAYEVQSHLYAASDLGYLDQKTFTELYQKLDEICRMTFALSKKLRE